MFDKTVPMIELVMRADTLVNAPSFALPVNYGWRYYQPGDERIWAEIETSAGEFTNPDDGVKGFRKYYPTDDELDARLIFLTENDVPFATATAWFGEGEFSREEGRLHWVSVDANHQGKGLSYPLVSLAVNRMRELGHETAYLTTQTSSWVAIKVYHRFGFRPLIASPKEMEGWRIVSEKTGIDFLKDIE